MRTTSNRSSLLVGLVLLLAPAAGRAGEPVDPFDVAKQAVRKAIPYLWKEGEGWINQRGCVSCHQVPLMLWSLSAAEQSGIEVDAQRLSKWKQWSVTPEAFVRPDQRENLNVEETFASNIDTMNQLLVALEDDTTLGDRWKPIFTSALIQNQNEDGSWHACGQLPGQKRPGEETTQVTVMWSLLALLGQGKSPEHQDAAVRMTQRPDPVSTEYLAVRLLLARFVPAIEADLIRQELLNRQRDDGGWGWLSDEPSDALATGMALYALRSSGDRQTIESNLRSADQFLIRTQRDDGSWEVPGTKKSTRNKSTPTSDYWGTGWAVIGLLK